MTVEMPSGTQTPTPGAPSEPAGQMQTAAPPPEYQVGAPAQTTTTPTPAMPSAPPFMAPTTEPQQKSAMYDRNELQMMDLSQKAQLGELQNRMMIEREKLLIPLKADAKTIELKAEADYYTKLGKELGLSGTALANFVINKNVPQPAKFAPVIQEFLEGLELGLIPRGTTLEEWMTSKRAGGAQSTEKELADLYEKQGMPRVQALEKARNQRAMFTFAQQTPVRETARLDRSYQLSTSQLSKVQTPVDATVARINRLEETIAQNSPQADALVAPELLTIMAGGQGSGLRMNEAEIARIVGGRSHWETLKASINKWSLNPADALTITPAQRQQVRSLVAAVGAKTREKQSVLASAYQKLIDAESPEDHRRILAETQKTLAKIDAGTTAVAGGPPPTGGAEPAKGTKRADGAVFGVARDGTKGWFKAEGGKFILVEAYGR